MDPSVSNASHSRSLKVFAETFQVEADTAEDDGGQPPQPTTTTDTTSSSTSLESSTSSTPTFISSSSSLVTSSTLSESSTISDSSSSSSSSSSSTTSSSVSSSSDSSSSTISSSSSSSLSSSSGQGGSSTSTVSVLRCKRHKHTASNEAASSFQFAGCRVTPKRECIVRAIWLAIPNSSASTPEQRSSIAQWAFPFYPGRACANHNTT